MWLPVASQVPMCSEEIAKLEEQQYAGSFLLEKSAADLDQKLKLSDGPKKILIERIKKLKAAAAARLHALPLLPGSRSLGASSGHQRCQGEA